MKKELYVKISKSILFFLLMLLIIIASCKRDYSTEPEYRSEGTIIGGDARMCMCCGGWYIIIKDDTLRFGNLPQESNIDLQIESFPLEVRLNWEKSSFQCLGDEITVLQIEKK
jgi:hypothetical protein